MMPVLSTFIVSRSAKYKGAIMHSPDHNQLMNTSSAFVAIVK
jgi:hypothetical protein